MIHTHVEMLAAISKICSRICMDLRALQLLWLYFGWWIFAPASHKTTGDPTRSGWLHRNLEICWCVDHFRLQSSRVPLGFQRLLTQRFLNPRDPTDPTDPVSAADLLHGLHLWHALVSESPIQGTQGIQERCYGLPPDKKWYHWYVNVIMYVINLIFMDNINPSTFQGDHAIPSGDLTWSRSAWSAMGKIPLGPTKPSAW